MPMVEVTIQRTIIQSAVIQILDTENVDVAEARVTEFLKGCTEVCEIEEEFDVDLDASAWQNDDESDQDYIVAQAILWNDED